MEPVLADGVIWTPQLISTIIMKQLYVYAACDVSTPTHCFLHQLQLQVFVIFTAVKAPTSPDVNVT